MPASRRAPAPPEMPPAAMWETVGIPTAFRRMRVLYSDGTVLDFVCIRADSTERQTMLTVHGGDVSITGVTDLGIVGTFDPLELLA